VDARGTEPHSNRAGRDSGSERRQRFSAVDGSLRNGLGFLCAKLWRSVSHVGGKFAMKEIPMFAIVGHPNEGKSSIVATLSQDDSIAISPVPGETTRVQRFDLKAGKETVIEFVDTPGFQNPQAT